MHGPLVVVSSQMRVRTANKAFYEFFRLKAEDTDGAYIHELANGRWGIPALSIHLRDLYPKKIKFKDF
jgi:two-component system, chemotaxis family, CheB/CheR fusion protein